MRNALFALYVVVCFLALIWPVYDLVGNRIEPFVFGIPMSLAWVVGWVLLTLAVLTVYHLTGRKPEGG